MYALNFYSPIVAEQLRSGRKTATIRLGDKSAKYRKGMIDQVLAGSYTAQDLKDFSMMGKGGAALAPLNAGVQGGLPQAVQTLVSKRAKDIKSGNFRVDIDEAQPAGSVVAKPKK